MGRSRVFRYSGTILLLFLFLGLFLPVASAPASQFLCQEATGPYVRLLGWEFDPLCQPEPLYLPSSLRLDGYEEDGPGYYLVQFTGPILPEWKNAVTEQGAVLLDYLPDFTFIARMDATVRERVKALPMVRWVGIYQPGYRLAPPLLSQVLGVVESPSDPLVVQVELFPDADFSTLREQIQGYGEVQSISSNEMGTLLRVRVPASEIAALANLNGVRWIEPIPEHKIFNNIAVDIMGVRNVVWNTQGLYGAGQIVGICDTGLDRGSTNPANLHDDFEDGNGQSRVIALIDLDGDPRSGPDDPDSGHGTHVAGSVLGNGKMSGSNPPAHSYPSTCYAGVAPEASLYFQAVEDSQGSLSGIPADLNNLFQPAYNAGARIHTNSWGSTAAGTYSVDSRNTDLFIWNHRDFVILFAAGNDGTDNNPANGFVDPWNLGSPASAKNCITVGATENNRPVPSPNPDSGQWGAYWPDDYPAEPIRSDYIANNAGGMAAFSSRGPAADGRYKPDISAPGTWVLSVYSQANHPADGGTQYDGWGSPPNRWYKYMGGTSMATPLTAGAATLVRQFYVDRKGITPSAALIKATLINGATDMYPGQYSTPQEQPTTRPNNVQGWGRVNVENSLFPASPRALDYFDFTEGLQTNEWDTFIFNVVATQPFRTTLAWSDYPGTMAAGGGLVNDLDLDVTKPDGSVQYPNNASKRGATQYGYYDGDPYNAWYTSSTYRYAVKFTPSSYPVTVVKGLLFVYSSSYPAQFRLWVYDDNGSGGAPGTILYGPVTTKATSAGWMAVNIDPGVSISDGSFYIAVQPTADNVPYITGDNGPSAGRSWYSSNNGSTWDNRWPPTGAQKNLNIRAIMVRPDYSTNYDRVNNVVGVDINSPAQTGNYTVKVAGYNVPQGPQPYALVTTAAASFTGGSSYRIFSGGDTPQRTFGRTGVKMDFSSGPTGNVTVTMAKAAPSQPPPSNVTFLNINWDIASAMTGFNVQIVFQYSESDLPPGMSEGQIGGAYRWNGSAWEYKGGTVDTIANTVTVDNVNAFSYWALGSTPTAVKLLSFQARPEVTGIRLTWETAGEHDNLGFNLYRSLSLQERGEKVNAGLIPSRSPGGGEGASYEFLDTTARPGRVYFYTLEDVDLNGKRTSHGPVAISYGRVYLPLIRK